MDFPKSLARESLKSKKASKFPYSLALWITGLLILLVLARGTSVLNPTHVDVFNPRIVPNSSVTYNDKSIIRTNIGSITYPDMMGSSDRGNRLVKSVSFNGDQTYYQFSSNDQLTIDSRFSRDFGMIKYLSGESYSFVSSDGLYLKTENMEYPSKVYELKTEELLFDYFYETTEKSFYIITGSDSSTRISRVGSFGEQELYVLINPIPAPRIAHVDKGITYLKNSLETCLIVDTNTKIETGIECNQMPQNFSGINYYIKDNAVRRLDTSDLSDRISFQQNGINIENVIQHEDTYVVSYVNNSTNSSGNDFVFVPTLSRSVQLPDNFNISDFYLIDTVVYISDGNTLLAIDSEVPVSTVVPQWVTVIDRNDIASVDLVY
jgi:hypothetical protein